MNNRLKIRMLMAGALIAGTVSQPAFGMDGAGINASVPPHCEVEATMLVLGPDQESATSAVYENCNLPEGYIMLANHRPLSPEEAASITYDGTTTPLSETGMTQIAFRPGVRNGTNPVILSQESLDEELVVTFTMTAV